MPLFLYIEGNDRLYMSSNSSLKGVLCTVIGAICWGFSGACGQFLFQNYSVDQNWLTAVRMIVAGVCICAYMIFKEKQKFFDIWQNKRDSVNLIIFSILGLMLCQYTYITAIKYSNAGTATVLQYIAPVFIMIYVCIRSLRIPTFREFVAIVGAILGTFILATHCDINNLVISSEGLMWGLLSALGMFLYTLIPARIISKYGTMKIIGYGMIIGGLFLGIVTRFWERGVSLDLIGILMVTIISIIGTLVAFSLYLYGVSVVGPLKGSLIASLEPVSAMFFSVVWLKTSFTFIDFVGVVIILTTVLILSKK